MSELTVRILVLLALGVVINTLYFHQQHYKNFMPKNEGDAFIRYHGDEINEKEDLSKSLPFSRDNHAFEPVDEKDENFVTDENAENYTWWRGFVGSSDSTVISINDEGCKCELLSTDCLDTVECILAMRDKSPQRVYKGMIIREAIKEMVKYMSDEEFDQYAEWYPMGKAFQLISQGLFREWLKRNTLWNGLVNRVESAVNHTRFNFCVENKLAGRRCVIKEFKEPEERGTIEEEAMKRYGSWTKQIKLKYQSELRKFRKNIFNTSAHDYLLLFSHFSRIGFNLRSHILDSYRHRVKTIPTTSSEQDNKILRVALHIRRGDSCGHSLHGYEGKPSPLDSIPQVSGRRMCYETSVYMDALSRIQMSAKGRHLVVYVATDHLLDLMHEIQQSHTEIYHQCTWKFVHHSRDIFNYSHTLSAGAGFIEFSENHGALSETALMDIWHLSHGEVFVGHLGSRFGKLSWWQAIARHNSFVPFFTVDGHSVCCDIDEACGRVAPAIISMESCLTFMRDHSIYRVNATEYWTSGTSVRFELAADEIAYRKNLNPSYRPPKRYKSVYESVNEHVT